MKKIHGGNIWEAARKKGVSPEGLIDFSSSINPLGPPRGASEAAKKALDEGLLTSYPDPDNLELGRALASYHGVPCENIIAGNGSTEFIYLVPLVFRPERALIVEPAFSEYRTALSLSDCHVEDFVLKGDFALDTEGLLKTLDRSRPDTLYVSNPANPTGVVFNAAKIIRLAEHCSDAGTVLIVDEAFMDFNEGSSVKQMVLQYKNLVVLRSMTKFFSIAGMRLGCIIAHPSLIGRFKGYLPPWSVNTVAAVSGAAALGDRVFIERTLNWLENERAFLERALSGINGLKVFPAGANFFMLRLTGEGYTALELKDKLLKENLLIRELSGFKGLGPEYLRVSIRERRENELLVDALNRHLSHAARATKTVRSSGLT